MPAAFDPVPRHLRIPYRRMPVTHRLPHTVPPCTHGFPRNCMQCNLVPHSFRPTTPKRQQPSAPVPQALAASGPPCLQVPAPSSPPCPNRLQHPGHRIPGARSIRPPCPQAPTASEPPHPSAYSPRPSTRGFHPTARQIPAICRATRHLAPWHGPLLHIMYQAPTRQLPAVPAIHTPSAHSPPRLYTPGARDFPLMCTSVAHGPSRICALVVHGFSCAAQCASSAPTFLASLCFFGSVPDERPSNPQDITTLVWQDLDQGFYSRWPNPHPPRPLPHRSRR